MQTKDFLRMFDADINNIKTITKRDAIEAVKQDGDALRYIDVRAFDTKG